MTGGNLQLDRWKWRNSQGINWAEDSLLMDTGMVIQGFSARTGGVSAAPYDTLNVSYSSGDDEEAVRKNRRRLSSAVGIPLESWSGIRQIHGTMVKVAGEEDAGFGVLDPGGSLLQADAQITNRPGITLITMHADCLPVYLLDPNGPAIGLAHAGWKGTLLNIAGALVEAMTQVYGSRPDDLLASVGPGAGVCHYEVDGPVLGLAEDCFREFPGVLETLLLPSSTEGRAYLDLGRANALLLERGGIPVGRISIAGMCTICENRSFFSHRMKDKGRQYAFFALRSGA